MTMLSDETDLDRLSRLWVARPDDAHTAAVRARCHAALARQRRAAPPVQAWRPELAGAGAMALLYALVVIREALVMYGMR